ncbi:hypothetical protein AAG906_011483 [Vitis piasezkii]
MVSHIREDLRLSGRCGPLSGPIDPGGKLIGGVTRGPARMMPCGQACKGTHGKTRGRKPPQCPFSMCTYTCQLLKGVTSTDAFCQAACRFANVGLLWYFPREERPPSTIGLVAFVLNAKGSAQVWALGMCWLTTAHLRSYFASCFSMSAREGVASTSATSKGKQGVCSRKGMSRKGIFSLSALILSIQLVIGLPDSTKGATKGHVVVSGPWAGSYEYPSQEFEPRHSLAIPGKKKRDWLVEWVEKVSFDCERHHQTLLIDRNLLAVVQKTQSFILSILPSLLPRVLELDEHHTLRDLPFYEEARAKNAKSRSEQELVVSSFAEKNACPAEDGIPVGHTPGGGCYPQLDAATKIALQMAGGHREHDDISYLANVITQDIPNYFSDEEDAIVSGPTQGDKDPDAVGLSMGSDCIFDFFFFHLALSGCKDTFQLSIHTHFILLVSFY